MIHSKTRKENSGESCQSVQSTGTGRPLRARRRPLQSVMLTPGVESSAFHAAFAARRAAASLLASTIKRTS